VSRYLVPALVVLAGCAGVEPASEPAQSGERRSDDREAPSGDDANRAVCDEIGEIVQLFLDAETDRAAERAADIDQLSDR
jgi:hypothetical protein